MRVWLHVIDLRIICDNYVLSNVNDSFFCINPFQLAFVFLWKSC